MISVRPATHYQVDLKGTPDQVDLIPDEHIHYQVDLTGEPDQVYLIVSGWPKD
jgi:hypothetical protein